MKGCFNGAVIFLLLVVPPALYAAPPDSIRLPVAPVVPSPMPPTPKAVSALSGDQWYIIDSDISVIVLASPDGIVKIGEDAGPIKLRGKFVDGTGIETRTYKGKQVFTIEAVSKGRVEILIVPTGAVSVKDVLRVTLDVNGARPPPDPIPDPTPVPDPKPISAAWIIVVEETSARTPEIATVLGNKTYWDGLKAKGVQWRFYDKDSPDAKVKKYDQFAAEVGLPAILFLDSSGKILLKKKLPATTTGIDDLLKGGK